MRKIILITACMCGFVFANDVDDIVNSKHIDTLTNINGTIVTNSLIETYCFDSANKNKYCSSAMNVLGNNKFATESKQLLKQQLTELELKEPKTVSEIKKAITNNKENFNNAELNSVNKLGQILGAITAKLIIQIDTQIRSNN